jgi:hypothetical protein
LKQAFTEVEKLKDGATKLLTELLLLTSSDKNYCNLRQAVRETVPPCIPYLGIYLDDIMAIEVCGCRVPEQREGEFCGQNSES